MWKESYRTGIERIDYQHKALFEKNDELLKAIEGELGPFAYQEIVAFLKGYVVFHFRDEEAYQRSVGYGGYEAHKQAHDTFTQLVTDYDRRMVEENYPIELVKELAGTLTAWLIYHVADTDLKMVRGDEQSPDSAGLTNIQVITSSIKETISTLSGLPVSDIQEYDAAAGDVTEGVQVDIDLFGEINGTLSYLYTEEIAGGLFESMTMQRPACIDELVRSALCEITNITTGSATIKFSGRGVNCDIRPPRIMDGVDSGYGGVVLDTGKGRMKLRAMLDTY